MRITADILAISVTVEDECAHWSFESVETMARIAADEALRMFRETEGVGALPD